MEDRKTVDVAQFRRDMKALGYKVAITTMTDFKTARVSRDGVAINGGNVLTPEHMDEHRAFYDYRNATRVRDDAWTVIL